MEKIKRNTYLEEIVYNFKVAPVVTILGPRQCGKTSLAKSYIRSLEAYGKETVHYFDLEKFDDLNALENSYLQLSKLEGLIVIDEIQKMPSIFESIRVLVDDDNLKQRYLILGSASGKLMNQSSETLAGRISYLELTPFNSNEVYDLDKLWIRGGYPLSYLAEMDKISYDWRQNYILTFLYKDIPDLGIKVPPKNLQRFWSILCNYHGCLANYQNIGNALELSSHTIKNYVDILSSTFMIRQLHPWYENISKRQVKSPKFYIRDSGLLHTLLSIKSYEELSKNPILGPSWEGFMLEEIIKAHKIRDNECYFWRTQTGVELDLLLVNGLKKIGFEFKYGQKIKITKSMRISIEDLNLEKLYVIYPGDKVYDLSDKITVINLRNYLSLLNE